MNTRIVREHVLNNRRPIIMNKRLVFALLVLVLISGAVLAQSDAQVRYAGVGFSYRPQAFGAVLPWIEAGTPYQADAAYFANVAPHIAFTFTRPNPVHPDQMFTGQLRVYRIADLEAYQEPSYRQVLEELRSLDTTTLAAYASANPDYRAAHLPFMPVLNATQVIRAQPAALNVGAAAGIEYFTYFSQAAEPILEGQVFYTFQGITSDGLYYVSFSMPVETGLLPADIPQDLNWDAFSARYPDYLQETFVAINSADPAAFTPAAGDLHAFIASLTVSAP